MQASPDNSVMLLSPGYYNSVLALCVDRIFVRETIVKINGIERVVKDSESMDMICWNKEVVTSSLSGQGFILFVYVIV